MKIVRRNTVQLVLVLLASSTFLRAQAPADAPAKPACDCAELAEARARLEAQEKRLRDWPNLTRYRELNAQVPSPARNEARVVFMGDSITDLWDLPEFGGFFPGKPYIDRGISGQTTPQMVIRFRPDVIAFQPKVVVMLANERHCGKYRADDPRGNRRESRFDGGAGTREWNSRGVGFGDAGQQLWARSRWQSARYAYQAPAEKILELNAWIKKYAAVNDHVYLDYFPSMVDEHGLLKKELSEDGLHPNAAGSAVMAPLAEKAIQSALREIPASSFLFQAPVPVAKQIEQEIVSELWASTMLTLAKRETENQGW